MQLLGRFTERNTTFRFYKDFMSKKIGFQKSIEMLKKWDSIHQEKFYDKFPETLEQETQYDLMGFQQHREDEGFATELEGEEFHEEELDRKTHESLQKQLQNLSATAGREAASAQNLTVYNHAMTIWNRAEDTSELLQYLEQYAEERNTWNERENIEVTDEGPLLHPKVEYGSREDEKYVEEVLTQLITETMHEV